MAGSDKFMNIAVVVILFGALASTIADWLIGFNRTGGSNITGASAILVPLIFVFLCLGTAIMVYKSWLRK